MPAFPTDLYKKLPHEDLLLAALLAILIQSGIKTAHLAAITWVVAHHSFAVMAGFSGILLFFSIVFKAYNKHFLKP